MAFQFQNPRTSSRTLYPHSLNDRLRRILRIHRSACRGTCRRSRAASQRLLPRSAHLHLAPNRRTPTAPCEGPFLVRRTAITFSATSLPRAVQRRSHGTLQSHFGRTLGRKNRSPRFGRSHRWNGSRLLFHGCALRRSRLCGTQCRIGRTGRPQFPLARADTGAHGLFRSLDFPRYTSFCRYLLSRSCPSR